MSVTPGGQLDGLLTMINDPLAVILIHLAKSPMAESLDSVALSDIVECDFGGYASVAFTPDEENQVDDTFYGETFSQHVTWLCTALTDPQLITAVYITLAYDGGAPTLLGPPTILGQPFVMERVGQTYAATAVLGSIADFA